MGRISAYTREGGTQCRGGGSFLPRERQHGAIGLFAYLSGMAQSAAVLPSNRFRHLAQPTTVNSLHDEVELAVLDERVIVANDKGVFYGCENVRLLKHCRRFAVVTWQVELF